MLREPNVQRIATGAVTDLGGVCVCVCEREVCERAQDGGTELVVSKVEWRLTYVSCTGMGKPTIPPSPLTSDLER